MNCTNITSSTYYVFIMTDKPDNFIIWLGSDYCNSLKETRNQTNTYENFQYQNDIGCILNKVYPEGLEQTIS